MDKVQAACKATEMFGSEVHELKLGRSFYQNKNGAFHTIRYDFKPASIDHSKSASLEVKPGSEVNISFPNDESKGGPSSTNFKGPMKPCQKDCVLIYDHRSGEFTLEKLTSNINVKIQRLEGSSRVKPPTKPSSGKPITSHPNKKTGNSKMKSPQKKETESSRIEKEAPSRDAPAQRSLPPSTQRPPTPEVFTRTLSEDSSPEAAPPVTQNVSHKLSQDTSDDSGSASSSDEDEDESSSNNSSSEEEEEDQVVQASHPTKTKYGAPSAAKKPRRESAQILNQLQHDLSLSESESDDGD